MMRKIAAPTHYNKSNCGGGAEKNNAIALIVSKF